MSVFMNRDDNEWRDYLREKYRSLSLKELYDAMHLREQLLDEHRRNEPSTKRKYSVQHERWVDWSQSIIEEIHVIRDEIIAKEALK